MTDYVLEAEGMSKSFGGTIALDDVSLRLRAGEVHALLGENGAGKSTLIKILAGAYSADAGRLLIDGEEVSIKSPLDAQRLRLGFMHQQAQFVPDFTVEEELTHGLVRSARLGVFLNRSERRRVAHDALQRLGLRVQPSARMSSLTPAQVQLVALGRALAADARVLVLDEPTASLSSEEAERLFEVIAGELKRGVAVLYVSHRLDEVFRVATEATILRDGRLVATARVKDINKRELTTMIIGRSPEDFFTEAPPVATDAPVVIEVADLGDGDRVKSVSFEARRGELVGLTGLVGAGRSELAEVIFGARRRRQGRVALFGEDVDFRRPRAAIDAGIALVPEDRRRQGGVFAMRVRENMSLAALRTFGGSNRLGLISIGKERARSREWMTKLGVRARNPDQNFEELSGGNQQKVILAKWLATKPRLLILDEPTQGIDVGAKAEIYQLMDGLTAEGTTVLFISSDIEEIAQVCNRVLVMREGEIVADLRGATEPEILAYCFGTAGESAEEGAHAQS